MTTRPLSSASSRRRLSKTGDPAVREGSYKGADGPKRIGIACASCRRRKIRCDGKQPCCSHCLRLGRSECTYNAVTAEENQAVKERKQALKQRKDQLRATGSVESEDDKTKQLEETQLSARRRWNRTLGLDIRSHSPTSSSGLPLPPSSNPALNSPSGLTPAAHGWHISTPSGPRTAPATSSRTSYFDFAVSAESPYPHSANDGSRRDEASPAPSYEVPSAILPVVPPVPSQAWSVVPTPSPRTRLVSLPETTDYPLTPPTEPTSVDAHALEQYKEPAQWLLPAPIPMPSRRHTVLSHSHSVPDFPQSAPGPNWQLWHAIPSPNEGINPSFISPPLTDREALAPSCFPPSPVGRLSLAVAALHPTDLADYPPLPTPVSTYGPVTSLGLQLFAPPLLDSSALPLDESSAGVWAASSLTVTAQEAPAAAERYPYGGWTESWVEEQSRRRQEYRDEGSLPVW